MTASKLTRTEARDRANAAFRTDVEPYRELFDAISKGRMAGDERAAGDAYMAARATWAKTYNKS